MSLDEQTAASSTAVEEAPVIIEKFTPAQRAAWMKDGLPLPGKPADPPPAKADPAASAAEPSKQDNVSKGRKTADEQKAVLKAEFDKLYKERTDLRAEIEQLRDEKGRFAKQGEPAAPPPAQAKPTAKIDGKPVKPKQEDFTDKTWGEYEDAKDQYYEDLADWKAEQKLIEREQKAEAKKREDAIKDRWAPRIKAGDKEWPDFRVVALNPDLIKLCQGGAISEFLDESENGHKLLYELGSDMENAERIASLKPLQQFRELTKLEASLSGAKTPDKPVLPNKVSSASPPPTTLGGNASVVEDEAMAALARGDTGAYMKIMNNRERTARKQG